MTPLSNNIQKRIDYDTQRLASEGIAVSDVSTKLAEVVEAAWAALEEKKGFKVKVEPNLRVTLPMGRIAGTLNCKCCDHETVALGVFKIQNLRSKEKFSFDDHGLHLIVKHKYFGQGQHRIDPKLVCNTLGIESQIDAKWW